ncbi:MAG: hypothetical protein AB8B95_08555 [Pseudohongiellaceae bacterium]
MMLECGESPLNTNTPDWTGMVQISSLFQDEEAGLVRQVQILAECGAHVLFPSIEAASDNEAGLSFYVTVDTAIRVNLSLMSRRDINGDEKEFRANLDAFLESKRASAH